MKHYLPVFFLFSLFFLNVNASSEIIQNFESITNPKGDFFDANANFAVVDLCDNPDKSGINMSDKVAGVKASGNSGIVKINFNETNPYPANPSGEDELYYDRFRFKMYKGKNPTAAVELEPNGTGTSPKTLYQLTAEDAWEYVEFTLDKKSYNNFQFRLNMKSDGSGNAGALTDGEYLYVDDFEFYNSVAGPTTSVKQAKEILNLSCINQGNNNFNLFAHLSHPANVRIELISIDGKCKTIFNQPANGYLNVPFTIKSEGIYLVRMTINNNSSKIIKILNN